MMAGHKVAGWSPCLLLGSSELVHGDGLAELLRVPLWGDVRLGELFLGGDPLKRN